jgi:hypothetical protein
MYAAATGRPLAAGCRALMLHPQSPVKDAPPSHRTGPITDLRNELQRFQDGEAFRRVGQTGDFVCHPSRGGTIGAVVEDVLQRTANA